MITQQTEPARSTFTWRCPTCGKTGHSKTHHGAVNRLKVHWRGCPVTRPADGYGGKNWPDHRPPPTPF